MLKFGEEGKYRMVINANICATAGKQETHGIFQVSEGGELAFQGCLTDTRMQQVRQHPEAIISDIHEGNSGYGSGSTTEVQIQNPYLAYF